jgi:acetolactate synthase small subunit
VGILASRIRVADVPAEALLIAITAEHHRFAQVLEPLAPSQRLQRA